MTETTPSVDRSYPVRVHAVLDRPLSRWLWLVKWLLIVPHVVWRWSRLWQPAGTRGRSSISTSG